MNDFARINFENFYKFDLDKNQLPAFTKKNLVFLTALIQNDSSYRNSFDKDNPESSAFLLSKAFPTEDNIYDVVKRIDIENSTHLSVSGMKKEGNKQNNQGISIFVEGLLERGLENIKKQIQHGVPEIVDELAVLVPNRLNFSFATKFCTYCNRYCFGKDDYSIYDSVVSNILPYYAYVYLGEKYWKDIHSKNPRKKSTIEKTFVKIKNKDGKFQPNYAGYQKLIGEILCAIQEKSHTAVSRKIFDWMLWYYYKNDKRRQQTAYNCLGHHDCILE